MTKPIHALLLLALPSFAAEPAGKTQLTWLGHAAFEIRSPGGAVVLVDPWLGNPKYPAGRAKPDKADLILVTHGHFDHVGDTVELAQKTGAAVLASFELAQWLTAQGVKNAVGLNSGGTSVAKDVTVYVVDAMHSSGIQGKDGAMIYGGGALGYVISIARGPRLYHAGDTNVFSSMALIGEMFKPDVALLPIGGHFTMGPREAVTAVKLLGVKRVFPMHWGTFPLLAGTPDALKVELATAAVQATLLTPKIGETITIER